MIYPGVVFVMAIVTVVVLAAFVLPRFKVFFASFHATLPLPTRMLLTTSNFIQTWWWALLVGMIALRRWRYGRTSIEWGKSTARLPHSQATGHG